MHIAHLSLAEGALLAPMAGITDAPFRLLCHEQGAALTYTEMISGKGYLCAPPGQRAIAELLLTDPNAGLTALQFFGKEPDEVAEAARRILEQHDFCLVDLNMGCPAHKIVGGGAGSAMMRTPDVAERVLRAVVAAVPVPVTVKMRLGFDEQSRNAPDFARRMADAGASAVTVHGRTRVQQYAGKADWDAIAEVKRAVSVPVIGNGDVFSAEDALAMRAHTGCDAVMIGRGALGNPWIFDDIRRAQAGEKPRAHDLAARMALAERHLAMMVAWKGEPYAVPEMRKHIAWYMKGLHGAAQLRGRVNTAKTQREMLDCLHAFQAVGEKEQGGAIG